MRTTSADYLLDLLMLDNTVRSPCGLEHGLVDKMANAEQAEYWNAKQGRNWVTYQGDLDLLLHEVTVQLIGAVKPEPGNTLVDLGCGAGASTFEFARLIAPTGAIHGIDVSEPLIERARQRQGELEAGNVSFAIADAQEQQLGSGDYDVGVSRFGLMFFSDTEKAFRNIARSIRPGGRLVFAAWAGPEHNPWFTLPQHAAIERLGPAEAPDPYAPGPLAFRDADRVLGMLENAGLSKCQSQQIAIDLHHPGGLEPVLQIAPHVGPVARILNAKNGTADDLAAILDIIAARFETFVCDDGIRVPAAIHIFSATVE